MTRWLARLDLHAHLTPQRSEVDKTVCITRSESESSRPTCGKGAAFPGAISGAILQDSMGVRNSVVTLQSKPGTPAHLCSILGKAGVNISAVMAPGVAGA